jgi:hypothetical protein
MNTSRREDLEGNNVEGIDLRLPQFNLFFRAADNLPLVTSNHFLVGKISGASMAGGTGRISMRCPCPVSRSASSQISQGSVRCQPVIK